MGDQEVRRRDRTPAHAAQAVVRFNDSDNDNNTVADRNALAQTLRGQTDAAQSEYNFGGSWYTFDPQAGFRSITESRPNTGTRTYTSPGPLHFSGTGTASTRGGGQGGARVVVTYGVTDGNRTLQVRLGGAVVFSAPLGSDPQALPTQEEIDLGFVNVTDRRGLEAGLQAVVQAFVQARYRYLRIGLELGLGPSVSFDDRFAVRLTDDQYRQAVASRMTGCTNPDGTPCAAGTMPPARLPRRSEQITDNYLVHLRTSLLAVAEFARIHIADNVELGFRAEVGLETGRSGPGFVGGLGITIPWGRPRYQTSQSSAAPVSDVNLGMIQSGNLVIPRSMIPAGATEYLIVHAHSDATRRTVPANGDITIPVSDLADVTGIDFRDASGRTLRTFRILDGFLGLAQAAAAPTEVAPGRTHTGEGYILAIMPSPVTRPPSVAGQVDQPITIAHLEATAALPETTIRVRVGTGTPVVYGTVQETPLNEAQGQPQGGTDITIPRDTADGLHQIEIVVVRGGHEEAPIITRLDIAPAVPTLGQFTISPAQRPARTARNRNQGTMVHLTPASGETFREGDWIRVQRTNGTDIRLPDVTLAQTTTGVNICIGGTAQTCGSIPGVITDTTRILSDAVTITMERNAVRPRVIFNNPNNPVAPTTIPVRRPRVVVHNRQ